MKKTLGLLAIFLLVGGTSHGITLEQAEELAIKNYPKVQEFQYLSSSSQREAEAVKRERFGTLNLISSYTTYNKNFSFVPLYFMPSLKHPPYFDSRKLVYGISYTVPLYLGGTISKSVEINKLKSELYSNLKRETEWQLKFNVDSIYLNYLKLKAVEEALLQYEKSLKKLKEDVSAGVKAGKFAKVDLLKVDYSLKDVEAQIEETRKNEDTLKTALETLTGIKVDRIEPYNVLYRPINLNPEKLYRTALQNNNLLKTKKTKVKVGRKSEELVEARYGLKVSIDGIYTRNYGFDTGKNVGIGSLSVNLSYPLFEWNRKKEELMAKKLERLSAERELKEAELQLKRDITKAVNSLKAIQSNIEAYRRKLAYAKEVERVEQLKYESGKGDMDHLLLAKAHRFLTEAQLKGAYYDWEVEKRRIATLLEVENEKQ